MRAGYWRQLFHQRRGLKILLAGLAMLAIIPTRQVHAAPPVDYQDPAHWLCRAAADDICAATVTSTVFAADGTRTTASYVPDPKAPIDCFYVYPTISRDEAPIADLTPSDEIKRVATTEFARFATKCRTFAPLYRQITIAGLRARLSGNGADIDMEEPYLDVVAAWHAYIDQDNQGRGVVLIGHSQGAKLLTRLIAAEIDGQAVEKQLVSAILLGTDVDVPKDAKVGGAFKHVPLCTTAALTGCVVAYSSYLQNSPPGDQAAFGASDNAGMADACVDPSALTGADTLDAALPAVGKISRDFGTTFVENPGLITAKCVTDQIHTYLAIAIAQDARGIAVSAALDKLSEHLPGWGLHVIDVNLALGTLVDLVGKQSQAWLAATGSR